MGCLTTTLAPEVEPFGEQFALPAHVLPLAGRFRFGRLTVAIRTNDAAFGRRFARIFQDCTEPNPGEPIASELSVFVPPGDGLIVASISGHTRIDEEVSRALLPGVVVGCRGDRLSVPRESAWPLFLAHYFVHHVMAQHDDVLFMHAATVDVRGRGLVLCGEKGAGKSTLALALGARGHSVFGDEVAAIADRTLECLPFRRAVSIRDGAQAALVRAAIDRGAGEVEQLADGTRRRRLAISELFPGPAPRPVRLETAVFLRGFASGPEVERFDFSSQHTTWLGPLHATFSGRPAGRAALDLVRLFSRLRCYRVTIAGGPEEMAGRLEAIAEG